MTIIEIKNKYYPVATEWNELSGEQLPAVMKVLNTEESPEKIVLRLFKILLNVSTSKWFKIKAEDIEEFLYLVGFFFSNESYLTKQLLPVYGEFYGPDDEIGNMIMKEYVFSEYYFMQWQDDRTNEKLLDLFVAAIYRPSKTEYDKEKNPDGDCRIEFNENVCTWNAKNAISKWPLHIKHSIAHWYSGCRQKIVDDNPDLYGGSGEETKYGLLSVMRSIAKSGAHGNFTDVENMNINLVMIELNETVEEGKKLEQQMKAK